MAKTKVALCVHGTFNRDATWIQPTSKLYKNVSANLAGRGTLIQVPVQWSGKNTFAARWEGAKILLDIYRTQKAAIPNADFFVIGHSHGGSVIVYAMMKDKNFAREVRAAFLSTPFIDLKVRRELETLLWIPFALVGYLFFVLGMYLEFTNGDLGRLTQFVYRYWSSSLAAPFAAILCGIGGGLGIYLFLRLVHGRLARWAKTRCDDIVEKYATTSLPNLQPESHIFVRTVGDEAAAFLATAQCVNWLSTRLFMRFEWFLDAIDVGRNVLRLAKAVWEPIRGSKSRWRLILPLLVLAVACPLVIHSLNWLLNQASTSWRTMEPGIISEIRKLAHTGNDDLAKLVTIAAHPSWQTAGLIAFISAQTIILGFLTLVLLCILAYGLGAVFLLIIALFLFGIAASFGKVAIWRNLVLDVAVEPVPIGDITMIQLNWDNVKARLNHSAAYDNPEVHKRLANWM